MSEIVSKETLLGLVDEWIGQGNPVMGPVTVKPGLMLYSLLKTSGQLTLEGFVRPRNSIKEFFFPRHEVLATYKFSGNDVEVSDPELSEQPQLVLGARPCDSAALSIVDKVFEWDAVDEFYMQRRARTTVVSLACIEHDSDCFCTSVGLAPDAEQGSDALLLPMGNGSFEVKLLTDKGRALFNGKTHTSSESATIPEGPKQKVDAAWAGDFAKNSFDDPAWAGGAARCLSCGSCAYLCPTCHCFDIVDEGNVAGGCRVRNWDSCQMCMFTKHASGHNPRSNQMQRQRQRILHKFSIYPERFGMILCTGCGNCARNCPAGLGVVNTMAEVSRSLVSGWMT